MRHWVAAHMLSGVSGPSRLTGYQIMAGPVARYLDSIGYSSSKSR